MTETFVYDSTDIDKQYDKARKLPEETYHLWANAIRKVLPREEVKFICDIGCGTGRFSVLLAEQFSAEVLGIDPSEKMLTQARRNILASGIKFEHGTAEAIPLPENSADVLFISMTYHHIRDKSQAISEFNRVLREPGYVVIRTSTQQSLNTYPWISFFPAALKIEMNRAPDRNGLTGFFETNGFTLVKHETVNQLFADNFMQYLEKISSRGLSSLKAVSDADFHDGCNRLEEYCREQKGDQPIYEEIDLYVFSLR